MTRGQWEALCTHFECDPDKGMDAATFRKVYAGEEGLAKLVADFAKVDEWKNKRIEECWMYADKARVFGSQPRADLPTAVPAVLSPEADAP